MSNHWVHITVSYALVLGGFLALGLATWQRHGAARRRLAELDPRGGETRAAARREQEHT